jgi:hypothetical protein
MKKIIFLLAVQAGCISLYAQSGDIGIGTTSPVTKLDVNGSFRTNPLSPNTNGGSGNIPLTTSSFSVSNGNTVSNLTLPANPAAGQRMAVYSQATANTIINIVNTRLTAPITMVKGDYYEFIGDGAGWNINPPLMDQGATRFATPYVYAIGGTDLVYNNGVGWTNNVLADLFLNETTDADNVYNPSTGIVTIAKDGFYGIKGEVALSNEAGSGAAFDGTQGNFAAFLTAKAAGSSTWANLSRRDMLVLRGAKNPGGNTTYNNGCEAFAYLKAGDQIKLQFYTYGTMNFNSDLTKVILLKSASWLLMYKY